MIASIVKTINSRALSETLDFTCTSTPKEMTCTNYRSANHDTDDLVSFVLWISIELNVVMIVASVPLLKPLFKTKGLSRIVRNLTNSQMGSESGGRSFRMGVGKGSTRVNSASSEEDILGTHQQRTKAGPMAITRTVEVSVTHTANDRTFVHAALVGLPVH